MDVQSERSVWIGAWRVDGTRNQIVRGQQIVALEPRTMRLLLFLASRPGELIKIQEILDEVWAGVVVTSESVYQAVGALRRALADDSHTSPYIATVPRRGYRLVAAVSCSEPVAPAVAEVRQSATAAPNASSRWRPSSVRWIWAAGITLAISYIALDRLSASTQAEGAGRAATSRAAHEAPVSEGAAPDAAADTSIVVLPFSDLSGNQHDGFLADGMTEELIVSLAKIRGLRVVARTSSFALKRGNEDPRNIAAKLGIRYVLEGSVQRAGARLRVTTRLIQANNANTLWAEVFDRRASDLFAVQDNIGAAVATALKLTLVDGGGSNARMTNNADAHLQYLIAREFIRRGTLDGWRHAIEALHKAIALDPSYAAAFAALVDPLTNLYDQTNDAALLAQAYADADRAIALAPNVADGYAARGNLRQWYQFDWSGARTDLERALSLDSGSIDILTPYSFLLASLGRLPEAISTQKQALASDPLSADGWRILGHFLTAGHQYAAAKDAFTRSLDIEPQGDYAFADMALLQLLEGEPREALGSYRRVKFEPLRLRGVAQAEYLLGNARNSELALADLIRKYERQDAYQIAQTFAWRGDPDKAFEWFDRALTQRDPGLARLKFDPLLASLQSDSRFRDLLNKMHLPD